MDIWQQLILGLPMRSSSLLIKLLFLSLLLFVHLRAWPVDGVSYKKSSNDNISGDS